MRPLRHLLLVAFAVLPLGGCSQTIVIPKPEPLTYAETAPARVACFIPNSLAGDRYTLVYWNYVFFQTWEVETGRIFHEYAEAYLEGAFDEIFWLASPPGAETESDYTLVLELTEYSLETFRANLAVGAEMRGPGGERVYERTLGARLGSEPLGDLLPEGPVILPSVRNSTDLALREVLGTLVTEIRETIRRAAPEKRPPGPPGAPGEGDDGGE